MKKRIFSFGVAMIFALCLLCGAAGAVEPRASTVLSSYSVACSAGSGAGEIKFSYDVRANTGMDKLGISSIVIYKSNGAYVTTIIGSTENGLFVTNTNRHRSSYIYKGTSGTSYYGVVTVYGSAGGDSDSGVITTSTAKAP